MSESTQISLIFAASNIPSRLLVWSDNSGTGAISPVQFTDLMLVVPGLSLTMLCAHVLWENLHWNASQPIHLDESGVSTPTSWQYRLRSLGGRAALLYVVLRSIASSALLAISLVDAANHSDRGNGPKLSHAWAFLQKYGESITYLYTSALTATSMVATLKWNRIITRHLNTVSVLVFILFAYRDLVPLGLINSTSNTAEGNLLWIRTGLLAFVAIVIPLVSPRPYIPVDERNPSRTPNPEQTASILSSVLYSYLDTFIWRGYTATKISADELPPLADYDFASNLKGHSFKFLDTFSGAPRSHLILGLARIFRDDLAKIFFLVIFLVLSTFISPIGIYQLLRKVTYIESSATENVVRPWVYIMLLFVGPVMRSLSMQRYMYLTTRLLVRTESIFTQLIFEHSLRIRVNSDNIDDSSKASVPNAEAGASSLPATASDNKQNNTVGKIMNLVTIDLQSVGEGRDLMLVLIAVPLQLALCITFLYRLLGLSAFVGLAVMLLSLPLPAAVAKHMNKATEEKMTQTDARVQEVTETLNVSRMVKLFGWEGKMVQRIAEKRETELHWIKRIQWLTLLNCHVNYTIPLVVMLATFGTHTWILGKPLSSALLFSSASVFSMLQQQLGRSVRFFNALIRAKVSLQRITSFLRTTELLDRYADVPSRLNTTPSNSDILGLGNTSFTWSSNASEFDANRGLSQHFRMRIEGDLVFVKGGINLIVGPTGSGKTSLLMALLGEMKSIPLSPSAWVSFPRAGGVSYAGQEAWVLNETIKNNILFGSAFDEIRYGKVLHQCALERDISLFKAGDDTEVGERGITLSGGQKARLTFARAVYSYSSVILLDDVFAALDVHTAQWILEKCLKGDLIEGRTVLLVSHNVALVEPIARGIFTIKDGQVSQVTHADPTLNKVAAKPIGEKAIDPSNNEVGAEKTDDMAAADGQLILEEDVEEGHVSWNAFWSLIEAMGGKHPLLFVMACAGLFLLTEALDVFQFWFLGLWAAEYEHNVPADVQVGWYLGMYVGILALVTLFFTLAFVGHLYGGVRASRTMHQDLISSVLKSTMRWLDVTPVSRIITRCTQDIQTVDTRITNLLMDLDSLSMSLIARLLSIVFVIPLAVFGGLAVAVIGGVCGQVYIRSQLRVKRYMSNAKAPLLAHLHASIAGLVSIRAYGVEEEFKDRSLGLIDNYSRTARTLYGLSCWMSIRIDTLGGFFAAGLAAYVVYGHAVSANEAGFCIDQAVVFSSMILWWVSQANELEVQANSIERIYAYSHIDQEKATTEAGCPPAYWPASGDLQVKGLSAKYSSAGDNVLHNLSFHIKSGERIGIVGRTGSGKSSLTLALLQCIITEGQVLYDCLDTSTVNLDNLRSSITIIPQMPELLSGTLRQNLDPFEQYDDATLNSALQAAGFTQLQQDAAAENKLNLDSTISGGGQNLSVGQRQIMALARAIVRRSKLLILDEATSAIDYKTDTVIQKSLRTHLDKDTTLITVAHRLQTIMDADRIMVLEAGRIVEFDSPKALLGNVQGKLRALVDQSGDKDTLYAMSGL